MPEYVIGIVLSAIIGVFTNIYTRVNKIDDKVDRLELKVAEHYVTKEDLMRFEDKLDAVILLQHDTVATRVTVPAVGPLSSPITNFDFIENQS